LIDRNKVTLASELTKAIEVGEDDILMVQETDSTTLVGEKTDTKSCLKCIGEWEEGIRN
jgi:hypothetical protein